jgi:hypothetical protein
MAGERTKLEEIPRWLAGGDAISDESRVTMAGAEPGPLSNEEDDEDDEDDEEEKESEGGMAPVAEAAAADGRLDRPWPVLL